ncbi:hypothetical protein SY88_03295 [Clostridiales bacterium PH28_bin88]|nr:hypothetical protein SY88_03295 [Clostridiales bacterium PH28_bin88]
MLFKINSRREAIVFFLSIIILSFLLSAILIPRFYHAFLMQDFKRMNYDAKINGKIEQAGFLYIKSMHQHDVSQIVPMKVVIGQ